MSRCYIYLTVALFAVISYSSAQAQCPLTLKELKKGTTGSMEKFEEFITGKGYEILPISNEKVKLCNCRKYLSDKAVDNISRSADPSGNPEVTFTTPHKNNYDNIMSAMTAEGFKFAQELPFSAYGNATTQKIYFKDKDLVSVYSYVDSNRVMWYAFRLYKGI